MEANPRTVFQGKLFLFTNGLSGSASANSSAIFRQLDLGLIIGEPCLGPLSGTWGNPLPIELNQTKLPVLISSIRFNTNNSFEYRPQSVLPDIQVDWKQQEYFDGVDADLEALRKMIAK
ncbi:MAG: C-terminal processing protease CtpA/Prc [Flavobacteriales bacterium]